MIRNIINSNSSIIYLIFLFHCSCRLLTSSANLRVASTSVRSQPCFNAIVWIPHLEAISLVQKGVGTPFPPLLCATRVDSACLISKFLHGTQLRSLLVHQNVQWRTQKIFLGGFYSLVYGGHLFVVCGLCDVTI